VIPKGANVVLCGGAANRDDARWQNPDEFKLDRPDGHRHLTFGHGRHACVGMKLARRELKIAFRVLLDRLHDIRLAVPDDQIVQLPLPFHRGIANLPIKFVVAHQLTESSHEHSNGRN
jgi:cytochrome P450